MNIIKIFKIYKIKTIHIHINLYISIYKISIIME